MTAASSPIGDPPQPGHALPELLPLWIALRRGDEAARAKIIAEHMKFARIMAAKAYARRVYTEMEFADYLQYATVGLIEAVDRFEPERGIRFETFAASRVSGAILDGLRSSSEIQEQIALRRRMIGERVASLSDPAAATGTAAGLFGHLAELAVGLAVGFMIDGSGMYRDDDASYADKTYQEIELRQLTQRVRALVAELPDNQRRVIDGHYIEHLAFEDIAARIGLSRGRIAQLHKEALAYLRTALQLKGVTNLSF